MARKKPDTKPHRLHLALSPDEYAQFKALAEQHGVSLAQLIRTLVNQAQNKDINDTAKAIQLVEQKLEEKLLKFADAQDTATAFLINNMAEFYETKIEKLEKKVNEMAPYYAEVKRIFTANEAKKRKARARKRNDNQGAITH